MWLDVAIALSCGGGGVVGGWIIHAIGGVGNYRWSPGGRDRSERRDGGEPSRERISEVALRLRSYADSMAADVDAHQTRVQAVNNSLSGDLTDCSSDMVYEAVNQLIEANEAMQTQLQQAQDKIHDQAVQIETAERRAQTDSLTRVPNRLAFDAHLAKRQAMGAKRAGTLALLDVDHFKQVNDVYGRRTGDEVLRIVAKLLHARMNVHGLVARVDGEQFAVIMDGCSMEQARDVIETARIAIGERDIQFEDKRLRVVASAGIAEMTANETVEAWLQRASEALDRSKASGRNCAHWMDGSVPLPIPIGKQTVDVAMITPSDESTADGAAQFTQSASPLVDDSGTPAAARERDAETGEFDYLPDRQVLGETFSEIRGRIKSISMFVMAVRCHGPADKTCMRSLLQIVRATIRLVDRIGCNDDATLLVCMPSIDQATAIERGHQIRRVVDAIQLANEDSQRCSVTIGLAAANRAARYDDVVACATELAERAHREGSDPIRAQQAMVV